MADRETIEGYLYGWRANRFNLNTFKMVSPLRKEFVWNKEILKAGCAVVDMMPMIPMMYMPLVNVETHIEQAPIWDCRCGFYSYDTLEAYHGDMDYKDGSDDILVLVLAKLWGKVMQHEKGYRSEYISLDTVFLPATNMWVGEYIQQDIDVVIEPIQNAIQYDKLLPRRSREGNEDG